MEAATFRENQEGLYECKFFNVIVSTDDESPGHIAKVIYDKLTVYKIVQVVKLFNYDMEKGMSYYVEQEIFDNERLSNPAKNTPTTRWPASSSYHDVSKVDSFLPIIRYVIAGDILDMVKTKELIYHDLSIYNKWNPEIDRAFGLGTVTVALVLLCFWQRTFTRHPSPVSKKELPMRPVLRILFQPDTVPLSQESSSKLSPSPPLYHSSSQQRYHNKNEEDSKDDMGVFG